jgi:hypothetical protein
MGNSFSHNEAIVDNDDHAILSELSLLLVTLELVSTHLDDQETWVQHLHDKLRKEQKRELFRQNRTKEVEKPRRKTFMDITLRLSERQFQRTFRMQRNSFYKLSAMIGNTIGTMSSNLKQQQESRRRPEFENSWGLQHPPAVSLSHLEIASLYFGLM